jgi:shikimate dehydrogenase
VSYSFSAPRGTTHIVGVVGDPVAHSLSPVLHNAGFATLGLDWVYAAFPVAKEHGPSIVASMRTMGIRGLSVTMPHKVEVCESADEATDDVRLLGAANTLVHRSDGVISAHTTDGDGCVDALRHNGFDPAGQTCMVLGAGGAGRAVVLALARAGAREIVIVNRNVDRAEAARALANDAGSIGTVGGTARATVCALIVNATSVGMGVAASENVSPIESSLLGSGQTVNDLVYHPLETALLAAARVAGARTVGGVEMLLHQAARQFTLWTGEVAPVDAMRTALLNEISQRAKA